MLFRSSPDGAPGGVRIVTASGDNTARLWDGEGRELAVLGGHTEDVRSAAFSPGGDQIVTASWDNTARLWDLEGRELAVLQGHTNWVRSAAFSPGGDQIVTASDDYTARLWDAEATVNEALRRLNREPEAVVPNLCGRYFQGAEADCDRLLAELFPDRE